MYARGRPDRTVRWRAPTASTCRGSAFELGMQGVRYVRVTGLAQPLRGTAAGPMSSETSDRSGGSSWRQCCNRQRVTLKR
jgi:hypothetical protein